MKPEVALCLDLGTRMGWASWAHGVPVWGRKTWPSKPEAARYAEFMIWLDQQITLLEVRLIVFEEVNRHLSNRSAMVYGGLRGCMLATARLRNVGVHPVGVSQIKARAAGSGKAPKEAMVSAARDFVQRRTGKIPNLDLDNDNDKADAICMLMLWKDHRLPSVKCP